MIPHLIDLGGVTIHGLDSPDGVNFYSLTGWFGVDEIRGSLDAIPGAHGSYGRLDRWRDSRAVTVRGTLSAGSRADLEALRDRVLWAWESAPVMRVHDETGVWSRTVEVDLVAFPDDAGWKTTVDFVIDVLAPDPVRYSEVLTAGPASLPVQSGGLVLPSAFPWDLGVSERAVASVVNWGELPVLPRVIVTGSGTGLVVRGGPYRLVFGAWDGVLVFDSKDRRAWLNGNDVTRDLIRREWPVVAPGVSADFLFDSDGIAAGTELLVEYRIGVW